MNGWVVAGTIAGMVAYLPLWKQIFLRKVRQNFATWILWAAIDGTAAATIIAQDGNFLLPSGYSLTCLITAFLILRSRSFRWKWFETLVAGLVGVCFIIWYLSGSRQATIASTTAMLIAGIPQLLESYRKPWDSPFGVYVMFMVAPICSMIGGRGWSVEERLYPGAVVIYGVVIVAFTARKFWRKKPESVTSTE